MRRRPQEINHDRHNREQRLYFERSVKRTMVPTGSRYLHDHVDRLLGFADISPGQRVLEVGCGMGRYTLLLAEKGIAVSGLDISPVLLKRLASYNDGRYNIPLFSGDILNPPAELRQSFDAVVGFFTLHHVHDIAASLASMTSLLHQGGRLAFLEPNPVNPLYYIQIAITPRMDWQSERNIVKMRQAYLLPAMRSAGLRHVYTKRFGFFPPLIKNCPGGALLEGVLEGLSICNPILPFQIFKGTRQ